MIMKLSSNLATACAVLALSVSVRAADQKEHQFYGDAPDEHHPWAIHDSNRPQPLIVTPGNFSNQEKPGQPPSDAIVLFDGSDISKWEADANGHVPTKWVVRDGAMECVPSSGFVRTKEEFGDCQLHVEWAAPTKAEGHSQGRGNSGVFLMGLFEIQVLDNYNNPTYADGMAASLYGQHEPMANALRPPGQWQVYDIVFRRPIYKGNDLVEAGYVTVFENGVLVQDHAVIEGETGHMGRTRAHAIPNAGPLKLQDHGNPVRYRNIWYRRLPARAVEGGTDGYLTAEATTAKRAEIAAGLRQDAAKAVNPANPLPEMLLLAESLTYTKDEATYQKVDKTLVQYLADFKQLPADKAAAKKDEVRRLREVFQYLIKFKVFPAGYAPKAEIDAIIKDHAWDKR